MFLGCMLAGLQASPKVQRDRVSLLEELRHLLKILEGELEYAHASLPEAFLKAGESRDPYGLFFSGMAEKRSGHPLEKVGVKFSEKNRQLRYFPGRR